MRRFLIAALAALGLGVAATAAYAQCYTETYFVNGKYTVCTICYYGNNRSVTCF